MSYLLKKQVIGLLKKEGLAPLKRLGQNFLIDCQALQKIIGSADLKKTDTVLEIGAGIGNLTFELAKKAKRVIAVEKDPKMIEILKDLLECQNVKNVKIIEGNILKFKTDSLELKTYKLVANLPYYITSPVIRKFLESKNPPSSIVLMVQKEVAQRIAAKPPHMSLLAVSVQFYAEPKIISYVSKGSFWPRPKVDSAIIKIVPRKSAEIDVTPRSFFAIAKAGFSQPRKQILNNFFGGLGINKEVAKDWLLKNKIKPEQRAETLNVDDWENLAKSFPTP